MTVHDLELLALLLSPDAALRAAARHLRRRRLTLLSQAAARFAAPSEGRP
jgi:hypothetical protein